MTVCNMSIEAGARAGMIAPDETTFAYLQGRPHAPQGDEWDDAVAYWRTLTHRRRRDVRREVVVDAAALAPFVTWGTNPGQGVAARRGVSRPRPTSPTTPSASPPSGRWSTWA